MRAFNGTINIAGANVPVIATVSPAINKDFIQLSITATYNSFTFTKQYVIRGGDVPPSIVNDFTSHTLAAYVGETDTSNFLISAGFTEIIPESP